MKILKYFLDILKQYNRLFSNNDKNINRDTNIDLPYHFSESEKITRTIFSPMNIRKDGSLRNNSFTTPANKDEVSVNRLDYTTPNFIKKISKLISNPDKDRSYYGISVINVREIYESDSDIVYSPNNIIIDKNKIENKFHSDIKIGFIKESGRQLPMKYAYKVEQMVNKARFYEDNNPSSEFWDSGNLV